MCSANPGLISQGRAMVSSHPTSEMKSLQGVTASLTHLNPPDSHFLGGIAPAHLCKLHRGSWVSGSPI